MFLLLTCCILHMYISSQKRAGCFNSNQSLLKRKKKKPQQEKGARLFSCYLLFIRYSATESLKWCSVWNDFCWFIGGSNWIPSFINLKVQEAHRGETDGPKYDSYHSCSCILWMQAHECGRSCCIISGITVFGTSLFWQCDLPRW